MYNTIGNALTTKDLGKFIIDNHKVINSLWIQSKEHNIEDDYKDGDDFIISCSTFVAMHITPEETHSGDNDQFTNLVHNLTMHFTLESLIDKGLMTKFIENGTPKYSMKE